MGSKKSSADESLGELLDELKHDGGDTRELI